MRTIRTHTGGLLSALILLLLLLAVSAVPAKAAGGPVITEQPTDQFTPVSVSSVYFHVKAQGDGLKFQWYWYGGPSTSGAKTAEDAYPYPQFMVNSTANESTMRLDMYNGPNSNLSGTHVFCRVTDKNGNSEDSGIATAYIKPEIQVQPTDQSAREGETVTLSFRVRANLPVYRWQICPDGASMYSDVEGGSKEDLPLTVTGFDNALVRCIVTDKWNNEVTSAEVKVTNLNQYDAKITRQPADQYTALSTDTATFTVKAEGENLRFVWYWFGGSAAPDETYETALYCPFPARSTENSSTLNLDMYAGFVNGIPHTNAGTHVFCRVYSKGGKPVDSRIATAYTRPEITAQPTGGTFAEGESVTLSCKARGIQPKYQWYRAPRSGGSFAPIDGATKASYPFTMDYTNNGARFYCEVTDAWGNTNQTYPVTVTMKDLALIEKVDLTFKPPKAGEKNPKAVVTLKEDAQYIVDNTPEWMPLDKVSGMDIGSFTTAAGETYHFSVALKPKAGYRFSTAAMSQLFSSDSSKSREAATSTEGFSGWPTLVSFRTDRLVLDIHYTTGMVYYIQPESAMAENEGDEVYINAKVKGSHGNLKYCLYLKDTGPDAAGDDDVPADENEPLPIDENSTGDFHIRAEKTTYSYYIIARDYILGTDQYMESAPSNTFTVSVREKAQLSIVQQPKDLVLDEVGPGTSRIIFMEARGDNHPLHYELFRAGSEDPAAEFDTPGTYGYIPLPTEDAGVAGTYYIVVKDTVTNETVTSDSFNISLRNWLRIKRVDLYMEVPEIPGEGGEAPRIQLLSEFGTRIDAIPAYLPYTAECSFSGGKIVTDATGAETPYQIFVNYSIKDTEAEFSDYCFDSDTVFTVNGKQFDSGMTGSGIWKYAQLVVPLPDLPQPPVPEVPEEPAEPTSFVQAVGLSYSQPVAGQPNTQPNLEIAMDPEDVLFSLENAADIRWGRLDGNAVSYDFDSFFPGETYCFTAVIRLSAEETRGFSEDTAVTVTDGQGGVSDRSFSGSTLTVTVTCTLPEAAPAAGEDPTITFEPEGGTPVKPLSLPAGSDLSAPEPPLRKDFSFAGWYLDEGLTKSFDFGKEKMPDHDITLFAKWEAGEASISAVLQPDEDSGEIARYIPNTDFVADVTVAIADPSTIPDLDALSVILASYDEDGKYLGTTYAYKDTLEDGVYHGTFRVSNKSGDVGRVSVFAMEKKDSTPLAEAISFWQESDSSEQ